MSKDQIKKDIKNLQIALEHIQKTIDYSYIENQLIEEIELLKLEI